ncbi:MAG TPA: hypothetical protein VIB11_03740 [Pedococcus sp.]|jgi:hypothetical protein|uniref:hypothetical protein n=1 Tax=Pedococcus sp. TaxID=2860345 RepID=UPI002F9428C3
MSVLRLADQETVADLATLVTRARSVDPEGAIRLQALGHTLAAYVGVLPGAGVLAEGAVVGLRAMPLADPADVDVTVPLGAVADRLARPTPDGSLPLPPMTVAAAWAAIAPPRSGWERVGAVAADEVCAIAREGIRRVAEGTPAIAGGHAVGSLRARVWGEATPTTPPFPAGGAFAAYVLGFAPPGTDVEVFAHGRWTRLSAAGGHVLIR